MRWPSFVVLLGLSSYGACATSRSSDSKYHRASTCPSVTVNYITQPLFQQCRPTEWSSPEAVTATNQEKVEEGGSSSAKEGPHTESISTSSEPSATSTPSKHTVQPAAEEEDGDPLADQGNFLSFEQWKAQMLEKSGQSPDHIVGTAGGIAGSGDHRRRPTGINNALDTLGDDGEIVLDLSGFVNSDTESDGSSESSPSEEEQENEAAPIVKRSREAGTTSKERFNYASFDCAATVLKTNQGSKGATWILSENKDSYLINKCSENNKYFIVELCNDILIDTIVLGNFEFFSSTFRTFRVSISDRYPVKADKWREIGTFEARNSRGVQAFLIEDGQIWARYLKVELLTHYGKEYYCPISLLRVHGTTMMDDYRNEMKDPQEQDDDDNDETLADGIEESVLPEVVPIPPMKTTISTETSIARIESTTVSTITVTTETSSEDIQSEILPRSERIERISAPTSTWLGPLVSASTPIDMCKRVDETSAAVHRDAPAVTTIHNETEMYSETKVSSRTGVSAAIPSAEDPSKSTVITTKDVPEVPTTTMTVLNITSSMVAAANNLTQSTPLTTVNPGSHTSTLDVPASSNSDATTVTPTVQSFAKPPPATTTQTQNQSEYKADVKPQNSTSTGTKVKAKPPSTLKASPAPASTQESFFKTVHKRLQMLEVNSTLSLQYIEEQSRMLRDAFVKAEKKQLLKASSFLETLRADLRGERLQHDQMWQSTLVELQQSQKDVQVLAERLGFVADRVFWLERLIYLQFILTVICLGLLIFGKFGGLVGSNAPLELSLLQSIQHLRRSGSGMSFSKPYSAGGYEYDSPPGTPSRPNTTGGMFSRKSSHRRNLSDGVTSGEEPTTGPNSSPEQHRAKSRLGVDPVARPKSSGVSFGPLTPASERGSVVGIESAGENGTETEQEQEQEQEHDSPEADPAALKRAASSPPLGRQFEVPLDEGLSDGPTGSDVLNEL